MPNLSINLLLDQNIDYRIKEWLLKQLPLAKVIHTRGVNLNRSSDIEIYNWAVKHQFVIVTFDEDFSNPTLFSKMLETSIIRLNITPTTLAITQEALIRIIQGKILSDLSSTLVVVDKYRIRFRQFNLLS